MKTLYHQINNDIEYGLFEDIVDSFYLDSQIKDDFECDQSCYSEKQETNADYSPIACTHTYNHISKQVTDLADSTQQETFIPWNKTHPYLQQIPPTTVNST